MTQTTLRIEEALVEMHSAGSTLTSRPGATGGSSGESSYLFLEESLSLAIP
jgi:hypothetical protein